MFSSLEKYAFVVSVLVDERIPHFKGSYTKNMLNAVVKARPGSFSACPMLGFH